MVQKVSVASMLQSTYYECKKNSNVGTGRKQACLWNAWNLWNPHVTVIFTATIHFALHELLIAGFWITVFALFAHLGVVSQSFLAGSYCQELRLADPVCFSIVGITVKRISQFLLAVCPWRIGVTNQAVDAESCSGQTDKYIWAMIHFFNFVFDQNSYLVETLLFFCLLIFPI